MIAPEVEIDCRTNDRIGHWMETASGRKFWPLDPRSHEVDLSDIAASLSKICRFNGHTREFYSVAQHCVLVSRCAEKRHGRSADLALYGLFHDAAEAYCQDIIRPIKQSAQFAQYGEIERRVAKAIAIHFRLPIAFSLLPEIKDADNAVLLAEKRDLMTKTEWTIEWTPNVEPWLETIVPLSPEGAQFAFLHRYSELRSDNA